MNTPVSTYYPIKTLFSASFTFSAKEKDSETGFSYFGSRYYSSDLSIWLSVDPMSDKYPNLSPYTYCANNPIKLVDPNGETIVIQGEDGEHTFTPGQQCNSTDKNVQAAWNNLDKIYGKEAGKSVIDEMTGKDSPTFTFTNESLKNDGTGRFQKDGNNGGTMYMNGQLDNADYLAHELFHGYQELKGQGGASIHNEVEANLFSMLTVGGGLVLGPKGGTKEGDPYSEAFADFQCRRINETNFTKKFNTLRDGFKSKSIANSTRLYEGFDKGAHTPSLIKSFYK